MGKKILFAAAWIAMLLLAADILQPLRTLVTKPIVEGCLIPDFMQFYLAGKLVREGRSAELYHPPTYEAMAAELGAQGNGVYSYRFNRPAFAALLSVPFSWFSYVTAARIGVLANFAFLGFLVWKLP
ncbi:MAG TPA: hypothetical protein VEU62_19265, partial [Bryobacterales bacterium]|nr:hypothetical protein [Bryobacterales bacterium]